MKKFADTVRRLLSIVLNLFIVWAEPIALPMSWDWGKEQMFIFYTEDSNILSACICAMVAVGQLVCIFTVHGAAAAPLGQDAQVHCHLLPDHDLSHGGVRAGPHV